MRKKLGCNSDGSRRIFLKNSIAALTTGLAGGALIDSFASCNPSKEKESDMVQRSNRVDPIPEQYFSSRMVEVGMEIGDRIQIRSGLNEGDIVVTNGAYLINSEYIFKQGANPMSGMKM